MKRFGFVALMAAALVFAAGQALIGTENKAECSDHSDEAVSGVCAHAAAEKTSCCKEHEATAKPAVQHASGSGERSSLANPAASQSDTVGKGEKQKAQSHCPVMGGEIDRKLHADYKGKRIYFCCAMCTSKFEQDPEKYIKILEEEGVVLEKTPEA